MKIYTTPAHDFGTKTFEFAGLSIDFDEVHYPRNTNKYIMLFKKDRSVAVLDGDIAFLFDAVWSEYNANT